MYVRPFLILGAIVALSACQEPAGVGLGLIDQEGVDPNVRSLVATSVDTVGASTTAIGFADEGASPAQVRVLVGDVEDDVFGDVVAVAYLDASQPLIDGDLQPGDVSDAWLELRRTYVYGDTTASLPVALRTIEGSWQVNPAYPADTLFATGEPLATATVSNAPADSLVRWDLPESWVAANAATLLADDFSTAFEGFALEVTDGASPAPGAVFGFSTTSSQSGLRVVVPDDTLFFSLAEVFTSIQREVPAATPASVLPSRAYSMAEVAAAFDLGDVGSLPLARALLTLPLDRSLLQDGPFLRPVAPQSSVYGVRADETRTYLGELLVIEGEDARVLASSTLTDRLQEVLLGRTEPFDRIEVTTGLSVLTPTPIPVSLNVLPVALPPAAESGPRLTLTVIGQPS